MKTLVIINAVVCSLIFGIMVGIGLDLKKKYSWILGLYLFVSFFFVGLVGTGNINWAVKAGMLISFLAIFGGALMRWSREGAEKWLSNQGKEEK